MRLDNHARPVLNAGDSQSLSLHAVCPAPAVPDGDGVATVRAVIIPAPGADGVVPTRGGRTHRMSSPARLAAALNAQEVDVRIDFDHGTEDVAKTFAGTTEAKGGWLSDFRAEVNGAISAALALSADGADKLRRKLYKYMSPGLYLGRRGEIVAMSSLALLNNPNMDLPVPALNAADGGADDEEAALKAREEAVKKREEEAEQRDLNAATAAVDRAVEDERLLPAQREFALNAIQAHDNGIVAGIAAFEAAYPVETAGVDTNALQQRIAPTGAPRKRPAAAPAFRMPAESQAQQPTDESLQLHARVLEHAQAGGKAYRDSVLELAAQGLSAPALNAAPDGAQLATAQARVIDPVLTTAARGYRNAEHVHKALFPRVETGVRGGHARGVRPDGFPPLEQFVGQVDLVAADLLRTETSRGTVEVTSEPCDGLDVRPLGARRQPPHLHVFEHALTKGCHETLLSERPGGFQALAEQRTARLTTGCGGSTIWPDVSVVAGGSALYRGAV